ncbi:MAG: HEAT repeat domain-containing protein [bacterium]|nr:HEAT repeat domain-containing protein [bacterium]
MKNRVFLSCLFCFMLCGFSGFASADKIDKLINDLSDGSSHIRWRAVMLLGQEKDRRAVDPLIKMAADDQNYGVRVEAVKSLGKIGDKRAVEFLKPLAESKDENISRAAVEALAGIQPEADSSD